MRRRRGIGRMREMRRESEVRREDDTEEGGGSEVE